MLSLDSTVKKTRLGSQKGGTVAQCARLQLARLTTKLCFGNLCANGVSQIRRSLGAVANLVVPELRAHIYGEIRTHVKMCAAVLTVYDFLPGS